MKYACKVLRYDTDRALIGPVIRVPDDTPRHRETGLLNIPDKE